MVKALVHGHVLTRQSKGFRLDCEACPRGHRCHSWGDPAVTHYPYEGHKLFGVDWPMCPTQYLKTPEARAYNAVVGAASLSPLTGWPDTYASWVEHLHEQVQHAEAQHQRDLMEATHGTGTR